MREETLIAPYRAFVISPTEYGGQIEHAFDTAVALSQKNEIDKTVLVTRAGASDYLDRPDIENLEIREILPPRRLKGRHLWNAVRPAFQVVDLVVEHLMIRQAVKEAASSKIFIVLDTTRYPIPRLLATKRVAARIALFVHNAEPHVPTKKRSIRQRVLLHLERRCINGVDLAVTHGERQLKTVSSYSTTKLASVPLPEASFLDETIPAAPDSSQSFALCIGELRENKGIEVAMKAAHAAQVPLLVAGKSDDEVLARKLNDLAKLYEATQLVDEFLDKKKFDSLILSAKILVLPYIHFDAQSGVLAKAMKVGKIIIASDLPALREQAEGYSRISFVAAKDTEALTTALIAGMNDSIELSTDAPSTDPTEAWKAVADTLLSNV